MFDKHSIHRDIKHLYLVFMKKKLNILLFTKNIVLNLINSFLKLVFLHFYIIYIQNNRQIYSFHIRIRWNSMANKSNVIETFS